MQPHAGILSAGDQPTRDERRRLLLRKRLVWSVGFTLAVVLFFLATSALAQSLPPSPVLEFDQEGRGVKGYILYATRREDGVERRIDVGLPSKSATGRFRVPLPPLEKGTWRIELAAYNDAGESPRAKADPPEVRVVPEAPKPQPATKSPPAAKGSPKPSPAAQKAPPPQKKKKGAMGKLWTFIVGDDEP
jgi:hypothetical protein